MNENHDSDWSNFQSSHSNTNRPDQSVTVTQIKIPFIDLMWFLVKLMVAALPALMIASLIIFFVVGVLFSFFDTTYLNPANRLP